jgi:ubiquinone/menaquinone biosynthesis C-methylase UbiE
MARTSDFFDSYAQGFDSIYGNENTPINRLINRLFRKSMYMRYRKSVEGCQPVSGRTVLDVGCGPGHYSITLAQGGAGSVLGIDFADGMIALSKKHAAAAGVGDKCRFELCDFLNAPPDGPFDFVIVMGFMDYMSDPEGVVRRVLNVTSRRAFFSFPMDGGVLAWQRKIRYRSRCDLYMYTRPQIERIIRNCTDKPFTIEDLGRDAFVTIHMDKDDGH